VTFLLVALSLFVIIRLLAHLERLARKDPPAEPPPPSMKSPELVVLEEIRDRLAPGAADSHP
jgi:large-conductance mechanosensitive channel